LRATIAGAAGSVLVALLGVAALATAGRPLAPLTDPQATRPAIVQHRIPFGPRRVRETRRYSVRHYGRDTHLLQRPRVIVQHWTGSRSYRSAWETFAHDRPDVELGELPGVCAHFVIDRRGVIRQLVSLRVMCRHTVGLNWTAWGIEHVGTSDADVMGNRRQLAASLRLTRWLQERHGIRTRDVIGHNESLSSPYHRERVPALRRQTHGDFRRRTMDVYRRRLERAAGASAVPSPRRQVRLGRSVQGRPIEALVVGDRAAARRVLVVGSIHGDETAGMRIVRRLWHGRTPAGTELWLLPSLNPDGVAARRRLNARGVDLNRNFPWHWRPLGRRGDMTWSGPRRMSEPETRIARALVRRIRPLVSIWFHQPLRLVDRSGGELGIQRRFARRTGLPLRRLGPYPGTATGWQNRRFPGTTAFVVELPGGRLGAKQANVYRRAVLDAARSR
jgi:protein MpaA